MDRLCNREWLLRAIERIPSIVSGARSVNTCTFRETWINMASRLSNPVCPRQVPGVYPIENPEGRKYAIHRSVGGKQKHSRGALARNADAESLETRISLVGLRREARCFLSRDFKFESSSGTKHRVNRSCPFLCVCTCRSFSGLGPTLSRFFAQT